MGSRLADLAKDILEDHRCHCFIDDLPQGAACPCGGDGRNERGSAPLEGCWHCQAREALADEEVATKALEEIRGNPYPPHPFLCSCNSCIASRALATIRGTEKGIAT